MLMSNYNSNPFPALTFQRQHAAEAGKLVVKEARMKCFGANPEVEMKDRKS